MKKTTLIMVGLLFLISCNRLDENEFARIHFRLEGDFGQEKSWLSLYHNGDSVIARFQTDGPGLDRRIATLGPESQVYLDKFLEELKTVESEAYCSTIINCSVTTKKGSINKKNIECEWDAFTKLKQSLFVDKQP